jgi:hypothetical protein
MIRNLVRMLRHDRPWPHRILCLDGNTCCCDRHIRIRQYDMLHRKQQPMCTPIDPNCVTYMKLSICLIHMLHSAHALLTFLPKS